MALTVGPDGAVWFTESSGKIGRLSGATGAVTEFNPSPGIGPNLITSGPDGNLWFSVDRSFDLERMTPTGQTTLFTLGLGVECLTSGPLGSLWFGSQGALGDNTGRVYQLTTDGGVTALPILPKHGFEATAVPTGLIVGPDQNLWYSDAFANYVSRLTPSGVVTAFATSGQAYDMCAGPDGNVWFTERQAQMIGRIAPDGTLTEFATPSPSSNSGITTGSGPAAITAGPDGAIWFTFNFDDLLGRVTTDGQSITFVPVPSPNTHLPGIVAWAGRLWFVEQEAGKIGVFTPASSGDDGGLEDAKGDASGGTNFCIPNATQCSGNGVETCQANAQWGGGAACTGTTPFCANGACAADPPSCQAGGDGRSNCGAADGGAESCCTSPDVPPGTFFRTYTSSGGTPTGEADPATVSSFRLDKYDVTVGRFRQFVTAWSSGWRPEPGTGKHAHLNGGSGLNATAGGNEPGWLSSNDSNIEPTDSNLACWPPYNTWTSAAGGHEDLPINCVNWWEAYAFCIWDGGFLPTEAELEYASAGGSEQREYPWGSADPGTTNQYAIYGDGVSKCFYPSGAACADVANIAPVGTATQGAGRWGQLDLAGDVWEWTLDWFAPYVAPCLDCANFTAGTSRVTRSGAFNDPSALLLSAYRNYDSPTDRYLSDAFRCARAP